MANFTTTTLTDTYQRAVVQFLYNGAAGAQAAYGITAQVQASTLTGYDSTLTASSTAVDIDISKVFWSLPLGATSTGIELSWGISGSLTGTPFLYLNGSGYVNFTADGIKYMNSYTGADRRNYIQVRNTGSVSGTDVISVLVEIDKGRGYIRQM
jgi:hypothetical protein